MEALNGVGASNQTLRPRSHSSLMICPQFSCLQGFQVKGFPTLEETVTGEPAFLPHKNYVRNLSLALDHFQVFPLPNVDHGTTVIKKPAEAPVACR